MLARLKMFWVKVRDSLWFLPGSFTILAAVLAVVLIEIEKRQILIFGDAHHWLWGGGAEGARGVLSAIAGGLITVTGVVFSVTIVALQLASSQFTPRLLRNFTADRTNQAVLAVLIGTFTYTLLVLRVISTETELESAFVPRLAVTLSVALVLVSIGFLIYYIDHASKSIQLAVILDRVTRQTIEHAARLFPDEAGEPDRGQVAFWERPSGDGRAVVAEESGYLQAVDNGALLRLADEKDLWLLMEPHIGQFVLSGRPLLTAWPAENVDEASVRLIRLCFVLGREPTPEHDVEFGIIEISDIAVKALSHAINDPTTALRCIDRLGEILLTIGKRSYLPHPGEDGKVRYLAQPLDYERVVGLAFDQIRHFGASNPTVGRKLVDTLTQMIELLPGERHPPLRSQLEAVITDSRGAIESPIELGAFERMLEGENVLPQ